AVENTVNDLFADFLRRNDLKVLSQISTAVTTGRRQPDFELSDGAIYYGEGEWQSNYVNGFIQAIEFNDIPGCSGYFLIGYPEELRTKIKQLRLTTVEPEKLLFSKSYRAMFKIEGIPPSLFQGSLLDIPIWIKEIIQKKVRVENPDEFISIMGDIVGRLSEFLPESGEYPSLFEHIIALMPKGKGEIDTAKKASAYLLLNQLVFYRILSDGQEYPSIDISSLTTPNDIKTKYFDQIEDYQAVFDFDVASLFPEKAFKFILDMIKILEHIEPEHFTRDLLGNIFHRLIPQKIRKPVAAYYTNPMAGRLLANLSIKSSKDKVADFACGSGTLLMAAYEKKAKLLGRSFREHDHKQFIESDLTGIDIMPFAAHLAVIQLALKNPVYWTDLVRIGVYDSTTIKTDDWISSLQMVMPKGQRKLYDYANGNIEKIKVGQGALSPNGMGRGFQLTPVNTVIMNPPFTRKQFINPEFRATLNRNFSDYTAYINNELSYWSYFLLIADRFLEKNGRLSLVLPASILRQQTYTGLRKLLKEKYKIRFIIASDYRSAFSESASFREILLLAEKKTDSHILTPALFVVLKELPSINNVDEISSALLEAEINQKKEVLNQFCKCNFISISELYSQDDWFSYLPGEEERIHEIELVKGLSPLQNVVPNIIQGLRLNRQEIEIRPENTLLSYERAQRT
ncbi:MAG: N-6 DNA methylase, partial [Flavobacteriaceae bacterium]|nr:N-6 DNA methylase [Flavobacteriaceae bacterium]